MTWVDDYYQLVHSHAGSWANGILLTLQLVSISLVLGSALGLLVAMIRHSRHKILASGGDLYAMAIRGTPLLGQIYLIYYGSSQFDIVRNSVAWIVLQNPFACAIIALALNTSAYVSELFKGAFRSIPKGEIDAAVCMGMSPYKAYTRILIPRAIQLALPSMSNESILLLKGTSLVSTITLMDLMGVTRTLMARTYEVIELFVISGVIYLAIGVCLALAWRLVERPMLRGLKQPG